MRRYLVDYNGWSQEQGEWHVPVGFADAWQLTGAVLEDGVEALFVDRGELEMRGVLRRTTEYGKEYWYGVVDPATRRDFVRADLSREVARVPIVEAAHLLGVVFHAGDSVVLYDAAREVYGIPVAVQQTGGAQGGAQAGQMQTVWLGVPDWSTQRTPSDLAPEARARSAELVERERHARNEPPACPGGGPSSAPQDE